MQQRVNRRQLELAHVWIYEKVLVLGLQPALISHRQHRYHLGHPPQNVKHFERLLVHVLDIVDDQHPQVLERLPNRRWLDCLAEHGRNRKHSISWNLPFRTAVQTTCGASLLVRICSSCEGFPFEGIQHQEYHLEERVEVANCVPPNIARSVFDA